MATKPKKKEDSPAAVATANPAELRMVMEPGKTREEMMASVVVEGVAGNASLANGFSSGIGMGGNDLTACVDEMRAVAKRVEGGDLRDCEKILVAQAITLNAVFVELARRAANNMGGHPEIMERYFRLAFKAQAQGRSTMEALAEIKNPRQVTFAKQVNNANGHQQVNNGPEPTQWADVAPARTEETGSQQNKLLEVQDAEWVDAGAQGAPAAANPDLATVAAFHRPEKRGRKIHGRAQRMEGRRAPATA